MGDWEIGVERIWNGEKTHSPWQIGDEFRLVHQGMFEMKSDRLIFRVHAIQRMFRRQITVQEVRVAPSSSLFMSLIRSSGDLGLKGGNHEMCDL